MPFAVASCVVVILSLLRKMIWSVELWIGNLGSRPSWTRSAHPDDVTDDGRRQLWVIGFGDGANTIRKVGHRAPDLVVIHEHVMYFAALGHGRGAVTHAHHAHTHRTVAKAGPMLGICIDAGATESGDQRSHSEKFGS